MAEHIPQTAVDAEAVSEPTADWVTFHLADEKYGINVLQVKEVLRSTEITPVPGAPGFVIGIINLRGNVVTVIDARRRFGLPEKEMDEASRVVIIESGSQVIGMVVDSVDEVVSLRPSEIETAPNVGNDESSKYIQGVTNQSGELLILVDLRKLIGEYDNEEGAAF